jgi:hypothetical protein
VRIVSVILFLSSVPLALRAGATPQDMVVVRAEAIRTPTARFAVERAIAAAIERLEQPACQRVLSDFHDATGRTLQQALDQSGSTPRSVLAQLTFREEFGRRCQDAGTLAFTTIGGRDVFICSRQFWEVYRRNPVHVEALLIHELLHTLGLGENPPASAEITARVLQRCW